MVKEKRLFEVWKKHLKPRGISKNKTENMDQEQNFFEVKSASHVQPCPSTPHTQILSRPEHPPGTTPELALAAQLSQPCSADGAWLPINLQHANSFSHLRICRMSAFVRFDLLGSVTRGVHLICRFSPLTRAPLSREPNCPA